MKFRECPCHKDNSDCSKRTPICHSYCNEYKDWREEKDADNRAKKNIIDVEYKKYIVNKIQRGKKRKNEKHSG